MSHVSAARHKQASHAHHPDKNCCFVQSKNTHRWLSASLTMHAEDRMRATGRARCNVMVAGPVLRPRRAEHSKTYGQPRTADEHHLWNKQFSLPHP